MQRKTLKIGRYELPGNALLAPLAGYTDFAFRSLALECGAALAFTEMVSCKGLLYGSEKTKELLYLAPNETFPACQVFGSEPDIMRAALEREELAPFPVADVNMGCPVPKLFKNGEGSALLLQPRRAEKIVSECVKSGKTVTVKMRIGVKEDVSEEFARRMEGAGAAMITVHGRLRDAYYSGEPDYRAIERVKRAVKVPVIANGGIFSREDADRMLGETGADGVMVARGALGRPWIFRELYGENVRPDKYALIARQLEMPVGKFPARQAAVGMRKAVAYYLKGEKGGREMKEALFRAETPEEVLSAISPLAAD